VTVDKAMVHNIAVHDTMVRMPAVHRLEKRSVILYTRDPAWEAREISTGWWFNILAPQQTHNFSTNTGQRTVNRDYWIPLIELLE
jgi:hypothetical protein